jgi:hypothetical protein
MAARRSFLGSDAILLAIICTICSVAESAESFVDDFLAAFLCLLIGFPVAGMARPRRIAAILSN